MKHCPVCNAGYKGGGSCHRCKTDLSPLLAVEARAARYLDLALAALRRNDYTAVRRLARKSLALKSSPEAEKLFGNLNASPGSSFRDGAGLSASVEV